MAQRKGKEREERPETDDVERPHAEPLPLDPDPQPDPRDEEIARLRDLAARARADYVNLQRRTERDAGLEKERVKARVLEGFLQVFEYGRMAAVEAERHPGALAEGVKMVVREFERLLENEGVATVGAVGEPFDRERHEAIADEPSEEVPSGHILRVVQPGYMLGERVLRYAKVVTATGGSTGAGALPDDSEE